MSEIPSAWERAMERVEKLGKASPDELKRLESIPEGNNMASKFLNDEKYDLHNELAKYKETSTRKYLTEGAEELFLSNIVLPRDERTRQNATRAMAGIELLKENKAQLRAIFDRINNLFTYYEQARHQTYVQVKETFQARLGEASKALQQQLGAKVSIEPELQPQFQEEWRRVSSQLDAQYEQSLKEHKQQIEAIT